MSGATNAKRGRLGGLRHREVVRLLAAEEITRSEIARRYDVTPGAVTQFADRHAEEIAAVREAMDDEFAGIAIASKVNRVALLQEIAEKALEPVPKVSANGKVTMVINPDTKEPEIVMEVDARAAMAALKQVAEELGQLVQRSQVSGDMNTTTTYRIEGVSPEELR